MITRARLEELAEASRRRDEERKARKEQKRQKKKPKKQHSTCWLALLAFIMVIDEIEERL